MATIVLGSLLGLAVGSRLDERTRTTITQVLGLCTLVMGASALLPMFREPLASSVPGGAVFLLVVLSLALGTLVGSLLRLEDRTEGIAVRLRRWLVREGSDSADKQARFVSAFVTTTLLYAIGPMAILGALQDGLGQGASILLVKAVLDGIASIAFASALGAGVMASALSVGAYQGLLTLLAWLLGDLLSPVQVDLLSAVGGVILLGVALRLMQVLDIRVGDTVPSLLVAPVLMGLAQLVF
ncbi:DUF554 domain-containing protein [Propionibacteriaceae bacterium G1746]|uniref:DUF554 domain-containing protein n=1 Tax=Aestuariimicrobium sp. G57 TaxID=3418485 RepID=UPI003C18698E